MEFAFRAPHTEHHLRLSDFGWRERRLVPNLDVNEVHNDCFISGVDLVLCGVPLQIWVASLCSRVLPQSEAKRLNVMGCCSALHREHRLCVS